MWRRGRPPFHHGPSGSGMNYPVNNLDQYPQNYPPGFLRTNDENVRSANNNKARRDRARPQQNAYYSDDSSGGGYLPLSRNLENRGGNSRGVGRGFGPQYPQYKSPKNTYFKKFDREQQNRNSQGGNYVQGLDRTYPPPLTESPFGTHQNQNTRSQKALSSRRPLEEVPVQSTTQNLCRNCRESFQIHYRESRYGGRFPLILNCGHTMCQECIFQGMRNNKVKCTKCSTESVLTEEQTPTCQSDLQNVFIPNYRILGILSYRKGGIGGLLKNVDNISLVTAETKKTDRFLPELSEQCCFTTCTKEATLYCPSCEGIYCADCSTVIHKSAKNLMSHEPVPRKKGKFSLALGSCPDHPLMLLEFYCKSCEVMSCCYCLLDKHVDHEKDELYRLSEEEIAEFKKHKETAEKVFKSILVAEKRAMRMANFDTSTVKKEIAQCFDNCHARLEILERKLADEVEHFKGNNKGLDRILRTLRTSAQEVKSLLEVNETNMGDKKLNLKAALQKLRHIEEVPCFLLNEEGQSDPLRLVADYSIFENLEEHIKVEMSENSEFRLVTENELPSDFSVDDPSDNEIDEKVKSIANPSEGSIDVSLATKLTEVPTSSRTAEHSSKRNKRNYATSKDTKKNPIMERVDVQHINSMDSFFIQYKKDQSKLSQLNQDIENYVKMGGAQAVDHLELNELCVAWYSNESHNKKEHKWCRARVQDIKKEGDNTIYEMFFIDYGKTQTVEKNRIRDIPAVLLQKKPFAIECMVHNPMNVNWNEKAHYSLAKIINGKEIFVMEKSHNQGILEVDLMISSSDGGITSVVDILVYAHNSVERTIEFDEAASFRQNSYCPSLKVFPNSRKFVKSQKEKIVIANVIDPYNVFVHLVQHQEAFKSMCNSIRKCFKRQSGGCMPIEGTYALVEYRDSVRSNYHRAYIKNVDINSDKVQVLLVDWGLNVVVPTRQVRPLEEAFTKLESQAISVKLAHIAPYNKQSVWATVSSKFLHAYRKAQDVLKMVVQECTPEIEVALFDTNRNVDLCLNALMVENNLADSIGPLSTKTEWPQYEITNPQFSEEDGLMSSLLKKVEENNESEEEDLSDVKKKRVDVLKVESPDLIWVKFLERKDKEREMTKALQIQYSEKRSTKSEWDIGEYCVTELNGGYVRGKILEPCSTGYKIFLFDKVLEITMPVDKIYLYNVFFTKYAQFAFKSHLAYIQPAGGTGKWSITSTDVLQEIFSKHKKIFAAAISNTTHEDKKNIPLDMWYSLVIHGGPLDPDKIKYVSINNSLVKLGYAFKLPRPVNAKAKMNQAANGDDLLKSLTRDQDELIEVTNNIAEEDKSPNEVSPNPLVKTPQAIKSARKCSNSKDPESQSDIVKALLGAETIWTEGKLDFEEKSADNVTARTRDTAASSKDTKSESEEQNVSNSSIKSWNELIEDEKTEVPSSESSDCQQGSPYRKKVLAINDWLPPFRLSKFEFEARVTCMETGGSLFLHDQELDQVYNQMEANIQKYFESEPRVLTDHDWQAGQLCTIKYTDGKWYRGKILKIKSPDVINVFMIDFGSDHDLKPDALYREVMYTNIPAFATKVKLDRVYAKSGGWLSSDFDHFLHLLTDWCKIIVKGPKEVELPLVEVYNSHGVFINQKLCEICPNLSRCSNFPIQESGDDDDENLIECEEVSESISEVLLEKGFKDDDTTIEGFFPIAGKTLQYQTLPIPEDLRNGKKVLMEIGSIQNFDKITFHLPLFDVSETWYDLIYELQGVVDSLPSLSVFTVGTPCLARFSEDGMWYRARITDINSLEAGFVHVIFVDYGNYEAVPTTDTKTILPEHLKIPQQSWEGTVNIQLMETNKIMEVMELMSNLERKRRFVQLVKEDPLTVDLYNENHVLYYQQFLDSGTFKALAPHTE